MSIDQVFSIYDVKPADIIEPSIIIKINDTFRYGMSPIELYDVTRSAWKVGENRYKAEFAFSIFDGVIQEVYEILDWYKGDLTMATRNIGLSPDRWEFIGKIANPDVRNKYLGKSVEHKGQNPIKYVNIS